MIEQLLKDATENPRLFVWRGPLDRQRVSAWSASNQIQIPPDLQQLWIATGGGDIFESETILSPLANDPEYDIDVIDQHYWNSGVDAGLLIFHVGTWISAVRSEAPYYISMGTEKYSVVGEFDDLDSWYCATVRKEYAERYGLAGPI